VSQIEQHYRAQMQTIAASLDKAFNGDAKGDDRQNGFVLLIFPFDGPADARTNYVSNASRKDIVVALKEIVARFEGQPEISGRA
jgi:hypothetical protein